ncbi:SURF1 family protein [Candidatus Poriferisodalis sp.]|uniref:SURF1 family protein n=1 Tax=Candidatus Poriferisodalis sp. TaxID=3101277 RepID=UPI003B01DA93
MYSFARKPIWLAGHALAGSLLVIFVVAGYWQLSRHNEVRDRNAAVAERQDMQAVEVDRFFEAVTDTERIDQLEYRSVTLPVERFDWHDSVLIRNRSFNGLAGCHLAVPAAVTSAGSAEPRGVLIVAGWLHQAACEQEPDGLGRDLRPELDSERQIGGRIRRSQERGLLGPSDPAQGRLDSLARTDVTRIDQQTTLDLVPVYVELTSTATLGATSETATLRLLPPPELDAGPHLGYTFQWFSFAAVAIVGYTLVLRHQARKGESEQIADD